MNFKIITIVLIGLSLVVPTGADAQVDPTNATLLRSSGNTPDRSSLDSSRYTVRPEQKAPVKPVDETIVRPVAKPREQRVKSSSTSTPSTPNSQNQVVENSPEEVPSPEMSDQVKEMIMGGSEEGIQEYKALLHPYDVRQNLVEISAITGFFYQNSGSNYWYRRYHSFGPLVGVDATLWLTPFLGFKGEFTTGLASEIRGDPNGSRRIPADHQWWSGGIRFRKSFGLDRKAPHFVFGLDFNETRMNVPANDPDRMRIRTSGPAISMGLLKPSSTTHTWDFGIRLMPRGDQQEGKTGAVVKSGAKQETYSVGIWLGSRFNLDRKNQYHWQLSHTLDKSLYDGQADTIDPKTGTQPEGVYVNIGTTMLKMGYTWGE